MNDLRSRIAKLEKTTVLGGVPRPTLVIVYGETGRPSDDKRAAAKAEYMAAHPGPVPIAFDIIWATDKDCKRMTLEVLDGVGTEVTRE